MTKIRSRDASRIEDRRGSGGGGLGGLGDVLGGSLGRSGGGGGGFPIPGGLVKGGGGLVGLLIIAAVIFLPKLLGGGLGGNGSSLAPAADQGTQGTQGSSESCSTEQEQVLCGAVNDVAEFWIKEMPVAFNRQYEEAPTVFFTDATNTGCGQASAQTGPFYCPVDRKAYFDLDFLTQLQDTVRRDRRPGDAVHRRPRVRAPHPEPGRHQRAGAAGAASRPVAGQPVLGRARVAGRLLRRRVGGQRPPTAGCSTIRRRSRRRSTPPPQSVTTASSRRRRAAVDPESFTHGTSAQRVEWFKRGYDTGDPNRCTTFSEVL